jgi:hypothetical protein
VIDYRILNQDYKKDFIEAAATTVNCNRFIVKEFTREFWYKWLKSLRFVVRDVSPRLIAHITRHKIGVEFYVSTRRPDRYNGEKVEYDFVFDCNPQTIINISRKRLCKKAHEEIRGLFVILKHELYNDESENRAFFQALSSVMLPDCEYRGMCWEFTSCK